jgi:hypothetical protein
MSSFWPCTTILAMTGLAAFAPAIEECSPVSVRLHQGERQKAARGELRLPLPAGFFSSF